MKRAVDPNLVHTLTATSCPRSTLSWAVPGFHHERTGLALVLVLLAGCTNAEKKTAFASPPLFIAPTLVAVSARDAAARDRLEPLLRARLPSLSQCPAFTFRFFQSGLPGEPFLLRDSESLDDRMEVTLRFAPDDDGARLGASVRSGGSSDFDCVEHTIEAWAFSEDEWAILDSAMPATIVYRFKAGPAEREAHQSEAATALDRLCAAYATAPPPAEVTRPYLALRHQLPPRVRLRLDGIVHDLDQEPMGQATRLMLFGGVLSELAEELGLGPRCAPLSPQLVPRRAPVLSTSRQRLDQEATGLRTPRFDLAPTFVSLSARPGVSSAELERTTRTSLSSLSECVAFARERDGVLEKFEPAGDDLVTVSLEAERLPGGDGEPAALMLRVAVAPQGWSDEACVRTIVSNWAFPLAQLEAMAAQPSHPQPAARFSYRFRPDTTARANLRRANAKALAAVCDGYRDISPSSPTPETVALDRAAALPPVLHRFVTSDAAVVAAVRDDGKDSDLAWLWADSWRETELRAGVETPCQAFAAWPTRRTKTVESAKDR